MRDTVPRDSQLHFSRIENLDRGPDRKRREVVACIHTPLHFLCGIVGEWYREGRSERKHGEGDESMNETHS